jgi:hypothetical protein
VVKYGAIFDAVAAVLLNIQVFWNVTPCRWENNYGRFEGSCAFIFRGKQSKKSGIILLLDANDTA